jgi:cation diffusion facilitator family transporter
MADRVTTPPEARSEKVAAALAVVVSTVLMAGKFAAYALTGSAAVFSDALESIVNVLAGAFTFYAVILAHRPADAEHPYGHGKVEFLAAGFEGGLILAAALMIAWRGLESLIFGSQLQRIEAGMAIMLGAMVVNGAVGFFLLRSGRNSGSIALEGDGKHLLSDAVTSLTTLLTLALIRFTGWTIADGICALLIAVALVVVGVRLVARSTAGLMDKQDAADNATIRAILDAHVGDSARRPCVCGYHKLRHRHSGRYHWVDFHLVVPADFSVQQSHDAASAIEGEIERALGEGDATAHVEPCDTAGCGVCRRRGS